MRGVCGEYAASIRPVCGKYATSMHRLCGAYEASLRRVCGEYAANMRPVLLLLLLLSTNLYIVPYTPLTSGTLHTKHEHNTKTNTVKSVCESLAICLSKKCVLIAFLKAMISAIYLRLAGRLFQSVGVATDNALRPNCVRVKGTSYCPAAADRRRE